MSELHQRGIYNREEIANILKLKPDTVAAWERRGMPVIREAKVVLYSLDDVLDWMKKRGKKRQSV